MIRRHPNLLIFIACALAVFGALAWVTVHALGLERQQRQSRAESALQERVRLALWRMDSKAGALLAREAARPYFEYQPFYSADRAYTRMLEEVRPGEVLVPSPLLALRDRLVHIHFHIAADGTLSSPQAPAGNLRDLAEAAYVSSDEVIRAQESLDRLGRIMGARDQSRLTRFEQVDDRLRKEEFERKSDLAYRFLGPAGRIGPTPEADRRDALPPSSVVSAGSPIIAGFVEGAENTRWHEEAPAQFVQAQSGAPSKQSMDEYLARQALNDSNREFGDAEQRSVKKVASNRPTQTPPTPPQDQTGSPAPATNAQITDQSRPNAAAPNGADLQLAAAPVDRATTKETDGKSPAPTKQDPTSTGSPSSTILPEQAATTDSPARGQTAATEAAKIDGDQGKATPNDKDLELKERQAGLDASAPPPAAKDKQAASTKPQPPSPPSPSPGSAPAPQTATAARVSKAENAITADPKAALERLSESRTQPQSLAARVNTTTSPIGGSPLPAVKPAADAEDAVEVGPFEASWAVRDRKAAATAPASAVQPAPTLRPVAALSAVDSELFFIRDVHAGDAVMQQGFWVDWPALRADLLTSTRDLLPTADIVPAVSDVTTPVDLGRRLAAFPAELIPGDIALPPAPSWSPLRTTLVVAWGGVLLAIVAIAAMLREATDLAERRGRFVSAVTHELRTPLTTFVMYSQMLADGMVPEGQPRQDYYATLKREAGRLAGIVESVLEYARLSRRRRSRPDANGVHAGQPVSAAELLERLAIPLRQRAEQSGMTLSIEILGDAELEVSTDVPTLERILFNLVDNACKYASNADDKAIHLRMHVERGSLRFTVKDHGPGITPADRARIFKAFERGTPQADGAIPGLGLGLALSKSLAHDLRGDLRLIADAPAEFELTIPRA